MDETVERCLGDPRALEAPVVVCAGGRGSEGEKPRWSRVLRPSQVAVNAALGAIGEAGLRLSEYRHATPKQHVRAFERLWVIPKCIAEAVHQLEIANDQLRQAFVLAEAQALSRGYAPRRVQELAARCEQAEQQLAMLADQVLEARERLMPEMECALDLTDAARLLAWAQAFIASLEPDSIRSFLQFRRIRTADSLWTHRRRRSKTLRAADGPRRISRGRAPPFEAICQL